MIRSENSSDTDMVLAQKYESDFAIPLELAKIVAQRLPEYNEAKIFLFPDIKYLHDPETMPDIELAADVIIETLNKKEGILIYCHDDVDGYTSATIMYKTLKDLCRTNQDTIFVYPIVRDKDGYILNPAVLRDYKKRGVELILTVDFGISSDENFRIAKSENLQLVVCDHHEIISTDFPVPAVDPKRPDSQYPFRELAGVGVSFKLAQFLYKKVFKLSSIEFYNLKKEFFPLVMLGTISDRVILRGENRIFCCHGLQVLNHLDTPWIRYFRNEKELNMPRIKEEILPTIASAAYIDPNYGIGIFNNNSEDYVSETGARLKEITIERRQNADLLFKEAISAAKIFAKIVISIIPISKQQYLGSVSARAKDRYKKTSVVIGFKNGKCFGELRSDDIDLYKMLYQFRHLFLDFGGHRKAAGFTMIHQNLERFVDAVVKYVADCEGSTPNSCDPSRSVPEAFLNKTDIHILKPLAPFGEGNPAPLLTDGSNVYTINNKFNIIEKG